jgi:hypothetical protein
MEYFMRKLFRSLLGALLLALLIGCAASDKEKKKEKNIIPERSAEVVFKNMSSVQVKNSLMSACSQNQLLIQPDQTEVTCIRHRLSEDRSNMLARLINDEFARNITDNIKFVITAEGRDVQVVGHAYVRFASPLGIETNAGVRITRVNLRDDASFSMLEALLKQAGASAP